MDFSFTPDIAGQYVKWLSPFLTVIATYLATKQLARAEYKIIISFVISSFFALLVSYSERKLGTNIWENVFIIFGAAQGIYITAFKYVIEPRLNPKAALEQSVSPVVKDYIHSLPKETVKSILNPTTTKSLDIKLGVAYGDKVVTDKQFIGSGGKVGTIQE